MIEENGIPVRSVVVSTWRSGSTFFGDIINSHPGNFYDFEPLMDFEIVKIRGAPLADYAIKRLKALLNCDYTDLGIIHRDSSRCLLCVCFAYVRKTESFFFFFRKIHRT